MEKIIISLDQNKWIDLTKSEFHEVYKFFKKLVNADEALFPLHITRLFETLKYPDITGRKKLARIMIELSNGYSFQPEIKKQINMELRNYRYRKYNHNDSIIYIKSQIIKKGFLHLMGNEPQWIPKKDIPNFNSNDYFYMQLIDECKIPTCVIG